MKKYLLLLFALFLSTASFAQRAAISNRIDSKEDFEKRSRDIKEKMLHERRSNIEQYRNGEITSTPILTEDFSKFTAGSEETPDATRLEDTETGIISDEYFNTPGWMGFEVYQAGGCAFLDLNGETGMLITPFINTTGNVTIKCRVKSASAEGDYFCYNLLDEYSEPLNIEYTSIPGNEWVEVEFVSTIGVENSYIILFSMYDKLLIDDIEIVNHYIPAPTLLPETNITSNGFTANWNATEGVDEYYLHLYAKHTAQYDETYFFTDYDFSNIISDGTTIDPEVPEEISYEYESWFVFLPIFANNIIGVSGEFNKDELDLSYRHSAYNDSDLFILSLTVKLNKGNYDSIKAKMDELMFKRKDKQPLEYPSAGSTFKRPEGYFAAALIDECGLKGYSVGGAQVSEKHSGFVINKGNATCDDVLNLMKHCQQTVFEKKGVHIEPEVKIIG